MSGTKHISLILFFLILLMAVVWPLVYFSRNVHIPVTAPPQQAKSEKEPGGGIPAYYARAGEVISYSVNWGSFTLGSAIFTCLPNIVENGQVLAVMSFETNLKTFGDKETIFSDALTLLPVRVEREVRNLLRHEKITEEYDPQNYTVTVIKKNGHEEINRDVYKKDSPISNPILLPHYVRLLPELKIGQAIVANLARRTYEIKLIDLEEVKVKAGTFKAYHFESNPKQIEIWLSADKDKIPVKIQGLGIFSYTLEMNKYNPPAVKQTPQ